MRILPVCVLAVAYGEYGDCVALSAEQHAVSADTQAPFGRVAGLELQYIADPTFGKPGDGVEHGGTVDRRKPCEVTTRGTIELNGQKPLQCLKVVTE